MGIDRGTALTALPLGVLLTGTVTGCNPARTSPTGSGDENSLRFSWWGNPERAETTPKLRDLGTTPPRSRY